MVLLRECPKSLSHFNLESCLSQTKTRPVAVSGLTVLYSVPLWSAVAFFLKNRLID